MVKNQSSYASDLSPDEAGRIKTWHNNRYAELKNRKENPISYMGIKLLVPLGVYPPREKSSQILGKALLKDVKETDRVLDMGTGSGINAILAASKSNDVVAVDVNPDAVACAKRNANINHVDSKIKVFVSDVFENIEGKFDLIMFDPPFRWFKAKSMLERSITDENYIALTNFFNKVKDYLAKNGRVLFFFGTSGDIQYVRRLIKSVGFNSEELASHTETVKYGLEISYFVYRLTLT